MPAATELRASEEQVETDATLTREENRVRVGLIALFSAVALSVCLHYVKKDHDSIRERWMSEVFAGAEFDDPEVCRLRDIVVRNQREFRDNSETWAFIYFGSVFGSALLSAIAAAVIRLNFFVTSSRLSRDLGSLLAMTGSLLITFSTVGGFDSKWRANRLAAWRMEDVAYRLMAARDRTAIVGSLYEEIREITRDRTEQIVAPSGSIPGEAPPGGDGKSKTTPSASERS